VTGSERGGTKWKRRWDVVGEMGHHLERWRKEGGDKMEGGAKYRRWKLTDGLLVKQKIAELSEH